MGRRPSAFGDAAPELIGESGHDLPVHAAPPVRRASLEEVQPPFVSRDSRGHRSEIRGRRRRLRGLGRGADRRKQRTLRQSGRQAHEARRLRPSEREHLGRDRAGEVLIGDAAGHGVSERR